jgi:hypothetical protein
MKNFPKFLSPTSEFVLQCLTLEELNEEFTLTRLALLETEEGSEEQELLEVHFDQVNEFRSEKLCLVW